MVGVTRQNADASVIFEVLHTLIKNCKLYFGGDFDEESVRGNFLLVYEILDGAYKIPNGIIWSLQTAKISSTNTKAPNFESLRPQSDRFLLFRQRCA